MGYFSELDIELKEREEEKGLPTRFQQLGWRLADLHDRLVELTEHGPMRKSRILSREDLRYALPEDLETVEEVRGAIDLLQMEYWKECGFDVGGDGEEGTALAPAFEQIAFFDLEALAAAASYRTNMPWKLG